MKWKLELNEFTYQDSKQTVRSYLSAKVEGVRPSTSLSESPKSSASSSAASGSS